MKRTGRQITVIVWSVVLLTMAGYAGGAARPADGQVKEMRLVIEQEGLQGFLTAAGKSGWRAPVIPSRWYVEHTCPPDQADPTNAAREFGRALLAKIDAAAPLMQSLGRDSLLMHATTLVDVASWVGTTAGYGNFLLARRGCELALTGLGRLIVDLDYPVDQPAAHLRRCNLPIFGAAARARTLNYEAGFNLFSTEITSLEELTTQWGLREYRLQKRQAPPGTLDRVPELAMVLRRGEEAMRGAGFDLDVMDEWDEFTVDEPCSLPVTTMSCWNQKRHGQLAYGGGPAYLELVESLVIFREKVGGFPLKTDQTFPSFWPEGKRAFEEAWKPYGRRGSKEELLYTNAWSAYTAVQEGRLIDPDTFNLRAEEQRLQRAAAKLRATPGRRISTVIPTPTQGKTPSVGTTAPGSSSTPTPAAISSASPPAQTTQGSGIRATRTTAEP